ncbi:MAG: type IV pilus assembly protein FimV [Oceanococcus sp.]
MGCVSLVSAQQRYGPVKPGDTVYTILAERVSQEELNLRQWALATFALNPAAFDGDVGQLRVQSILVLPTLEQAKNQWRRGLALEVGEINGIPIAVSATPALSAPAAKVLGIYERKVEVPQPEWTLDLPVAVSPAPAAARRIGASVNVAAQVQQDDVLIAEPSSGLFRDNADYSEILRQVGSTPSTELVQQMEALEQEYSGDADFDYAYGVVLLDAGQAQNALFPLLRATQTRSDSLGIRLDLGRAYYEANDNESARVIFEDLKRQSPPAAAAEVIDSYLRAISRRSSRYRPTWLTMLGLKAGHDTNANSATDLRQFIGFSLDEQSRSAESAFGELRLETSYANPLSPRWRWLLNGQGRYRENFDAQIVNTLQLGMSSGFSYRKGAWQVSTRLGAEVLRVDGEENATTVGLNGGSVWRLSPFTRLQTSARLGGIRYVDNLSVRDVDQWLLALGINQRGQLALGSEVSLKLIGGQDEAVEIGSPYGRNVIGGGVDFTIQMSPRVRLISNVQWLASDYDGLFFGLARKDEQWSSVLSLELTDNRLEGWMLTPSARYVDNTSDVALYEFDRVQLSLALSHSFE